MKTIFKIIFIIMALFVKKSSSVKLGKNRVLTNEQTQENKEVTDLTSDQKKILEEDQNKDKLPSTNDEDELEKLKKQMADQGIVAKVKENGIDKLFISSMVVMFFFN